MKRNNSIEFFTIELRQQKKYICAPQCFAKLPLASVGQEILINMDFKFQVLVLACCLGISQSLDCKDCEMSCTSGKMDQCTGEPDGGEYCLPKIAEGYDGHKCEINNCPKNCEQDEKLCVQLDKDGCPIGEFCLQEYTNGCWNECPVNCREEEQVCSKGGKTHTNGCPDMGQYCMPKSYKSQSGKECPDFCYTECRDDELW